MDKITETKKKILKSLKNEQKIVINKCYGGFGLSMKALQRYAELKGFKLYFYESTSYKLGHEKFERIDDVNKKPTFMFHSVKKDFGKITDKLDDKEYFSIYDFDRDDEVLVQVVEELGKEANGSHSELEVVEIPQGVEWEIDNYDGIETVEEKHRSWG